MSYVVSEVTSYRIADQVVRGCRTVYDKSFEHLHRLDLGYHRANSKNSVFEINQAVRSMDQGLYYFFADIVRYAVQLGFIGVAMWKFAGPTYMWQMFATLAVYTGWTTACQPELIK